MDKNSSPNRILLDVTLKTTVIFSKKGEREREGEGSEGVEKSRHTNCHV